MGRKDQGDLEMSGAAGLGDTLFGGAFGNPFLNLLLPFGPWLSANA
jgi:hypothetical protein